MPPAPATRVHVAPTARHGSNTRPGARTARRRSRHHRHVRCPPRRPGSRRQLDPRHTRRHPHRAPACRPLEDRPHGKGQRVAICANPTEPGFCPATALDAWLAHRRTTPDLDWTASASAGAERPLFCAVIKTGRAPCKLDQPGRAPLAKRGIGRTTTTRTAIDGGVNPVGLIPAVPAGNRIQTAAGQFRRYPSPECPRLVTTTVATSRCRHASLPSHTSPRPVPDEPPRRVPRDQQSILPGHRVAHRGAV
jgi:hypothetical protein